MNAEDRWIIFLDRIEYAIRRAACAVLGHRWEVEREWAGDECYFVGYTCARCHRSEGTR